MELPQIFDVKTYPSLLHKGKEEVLLIPFGDLQLDPKVRSKPRASDVDRAKQVLEWGMEHNAVFIGMGDYADSLSPSNREVWEHARPGLYDSFRDAAEEVSEQVLDELKELLAPTKGRWLGLLTGHHYWPFEDGSTTDTRLAAFLGAPHLGDTAVCTLRLPANGHKERPVCKVFAFHGSGAGELMGASLSKIDKKRAVFPRADVYLMGHFHQALAGKRSDLDSWGGEQGGQPHLVHRDVICACTGAFLRGYTEGSRRSGLAAGSYIEKGMMVPSSLGAICISIRPAVSSRGYVRLDLDHFSL